MKLTKNNDYVKSLKKIEMSEKNLKSDRGTKTKVFFETDNTNYINLGIGTCRGKKGLYLRKNGENNKTTMMNINKYHQSIKHIVEKYIPKTLLKSLSKSMEKIEMEDFSTLQQYNDSKNLLNQKLNQTKKLNGKNHSFMPSTSFGRDSLLPLHIDHDYFLSIVTIHCKKDIKKQKNIYNSNIIKYFTFDNNVSVGLRNGDILIFNPVIKHCVSTKTLEYKDEEVFCVSHYFKTLLCSRNNNDILFNL